MCGGLASRVSKLSSQCGVMCVEWGITCGGVLFLFFFVCVFFFFFKQKTAYEILA